MIEINGELTGKLFSLLNEKQELSVTQLTESIPDKSTEIYIAIKLLARENIIVYRIENNKSYISLAKKMEGGNIN